MRPAMWAAVCGTLLLAGESSAAEDAQALLRRAQARFGQAEFVASAKLLERARQLTVEPKLLARILLQLGVCREVLGELAPARAAFRAALEHDAEAELEPGRHRASALELFQSTRESLRGELVVACEGGPGKATLDGAPLGALPLTQQIRVGRHRLEIAGHDGALVWSGAIVIPVGKILSVKPSCPPAPPRLSVVSQPAGADVLLDGRSLGRAPLEGVAVPPGKHRIVLRHSRARPLAVSIELAPGASYTIQRQLELVPILPAPPPRAPATPAPAPRRHRLWTWIVGAAALASFGAALGAGLASRADHSEWEGERTDRGRWEELRTSGERKQLAANVMIGAGAALAAGATVLFFLEGRPPRERPRPHAGAGLVVGF